MNFYHYTYLNAVHSMLDTHKIPITDIRFLNDKTEYRRGLQILEEASHEVLIRIEVTARDLRKLYKNGFQKYLKNYQT